MRPVLEIGSEEWLLITIIDIYGGNSKTYFRSSIQSVRPFAEKERQVFTCVLVILSQ